MPLLETVLEHLNDPSTTKKYVGLALAVKLLSSRQNSEGEEEESNDKNNRRERDDDGKSRASKGEKKEEADAFLSVCRAAMRDDFLYSLISPPPPPEGEENLRKIPKEKLERNSPENMQKRSLGINVCASLASGSRECALMLRPILEELCFNGGISLPRDSMTKMCEFAERTATALVHADDGLWIGDNSTWKDEDDEKKWEQTPLEKLPSIVEEVIDWFYYPAFKSKEEGESSEGDTDAVRKENEEALIVSGLLALTNIVKEIYLASKGKRNSFDPYEEMDLYDSVEPAANPYVQVANYIACTYRLVEEVSRECLYKRAGSKAALVGLEFINTMIEARILGENDDSVTHRYNYFCWLDFENKWSNELREGLKFILSSKSVDKRQRALAVHVAASVQDLCGDDSWLLKNSPSSLHVNDGKSSEGKMKKNESGGRVAAAGEKMKNITLFELVSQICRVEMQVTIYHLLESDSRETRYDASENLRNHLHSFGTLVRVFTLAVGGGDDDEGDDDVDDITNGLENLDITAEGAMKQMDVIVAVIGSLVEIIGSAQNYERLEECGADPYLVFAIADIVGRFANELEVVHVGEIDASMEHVAKSMRTRLAQIDSSSNKYDKLYYGWDRMETTIFNFNARICRTFETEQDPERLECQINSGFISLLFEMVADNISTKCEFRYGNMFDAHTRFLHWVENFASHLAQDMCLMLVEGWPNSLRALRLDPNEIERIKKQWKNIAKAAQDGKAEIDSYINPSIMDKKSIVIAKQLRRLFEELDDPKRLDAIV